MFLTPESKEAKRLKKNSQEIRSKVLFITVSTGVMALFFVAIFLNLNSSTSPVAQNPVAVVTDETEPKVVDNIDTVVKARIKARKQPIRRIRSSKRVTAKNKKLKCKPQPAVIDQVKDTEEQKWITCVSGNEKKEYYLPDNSKISMGPNSEIKYASDFKENRVLYFSGEAFFEITHKSNSQPFFIYSTVSKTEVIGTSFTIKSYKGALTDVIQVVTGKVAFSAQKDPSRIIFLTAGKECTIKEEDDDRISYSTMDVEETASHEKIVFNNTRLSEVINTLNGFYKISITTTTPEILDCKFTGTFEHEDIDEVMRDIAESFNLQLQQQEGKYILSGASCK